MNPDTREVIGPGRVMNTDTTLRWPDAVYSHTPGGLVRDGPNVISASNDTTIAIEPDGTLTRLDSLTPDSRPSLNRSPMPTSLAEDWRQWTHDTPWVSARLVADRADQSDPSLRITDTGVLIDERLHEIELSFAENPEFGLVLARFEQRAKSNSHRLAIEFDDYQDFPGVEFPVPTTRRTYSTSTPTGALELMHTAELVSFELVPEAPDSMFQPDVSRAQTFDRATGIFRDAQGNITGRLADIPPPGGYPSRGVPGRWAFAVGGVVLIAAGIGWRLARRGG